jgi:hypothetical protein
MPVVRFEPGNIAPDSGTYVLKGHYGEDTGVAIRLDRGERLPLATAAVEYPLWYVLVGEPTSNLQAA